MSKVIEVRYDRFLALGDDRGAAARGPVTASGPTATARAARAR